MSGGCRLVQSPVFQQRFARLDVQVAPVSLPPIADANDSRRIFRAQLNGDRRLSDRPALPAFGRFQDAQHVVQKSCHHRAVRTLDTRQIAQTRRTDTDRSRLHLLACIIDLRLELKEEKRREEEVGRCDVGKPNVATGTAIDRIEMRTRHLRDELYRVRCCRLGDLVEIHPVVRVGAVRIAHAVHQIVVVGEKNHILAKDLVETRQIEGAHQGFDEAGWLRGEAAVALPVDDIVTDGVAACGGDGTVRKTKIHLKGKRSFTLIG